MKSVKTTVHYGEKYVYFLIDFYKECVKHPKLKKVSFPIGQIKNYFAFIKFKLEEDNAFWM